MGITDFANQKIGSIVNSPHGIAGECVALASAWSLANGGPEFWGNGNDDTAWDIWQTFRSPFYQVIPNSPTNAPSPGDVVFYFPKNASTGTNSAGHVDVAVDNINTNTFRALDANWNGSRSAQLVNHNYAGVAGWFHPVGGSTVSNTVQVSQDQIDAWLHGPDGIDHWKVEAYNRGVDNDALRKQVANLQAQIADQQKQIDDLKAHQSVSDDSIQLNALGTALRWFIARLGLKN